MNTPAQTRFPSFRRARAGLATPRARRALLFALVCFVTAIALFYAEENWRGSRAWDTYRRTLVSRGESPDFAALIPPPVPDNDNFVATPFVTLLFDKSQRAAVTNRWPDFLSKAEERLIRPQPASKRTLTDFGAWHDAISSTERPHSIQQRARSREDRAAAARAVLDQLQPFEPVLDEFRARTDRAKARYPIDYLLDQPYAILLPHLAPLKQVANELNVRACAELATGNGSAAAGDVLLLLRLAESVDDNHFLISELVRMAMLHIGMQPIWEGLATHAWKSNELVTLQQALDGVNVAADLPQALRVERAAGIASIDILRLRNTRDYLSLFYPNTEVPLAEHAIAMTVHLAPRGWFHFEEVNYGRLFDPVLSVCARSTFEPAATRRAAADAAADLNRFRGPAAILHHRMGATVLFPAIEKVVNKTAIAQATLLQASTACALERYRLAHGELPPSLTSLAPDYLRQLPADFYAQRPVAGPGERSALAYRRTGPDSYVLYSVGPNEKDDGGTPGKTLFDEEAGDWVWSCP